MEGVLVDNVYIVQHTPFNALTTTPCVRTYMCENIFVLRSLVS